MPFQFPLPLTSRRGVWPEAQHTIITSRFEKVNMVLRPLQQDNCYVLVPWCGKVHCIAVCDFLTAVTHWHGLQAGIVQVDESKVHVMATCQTHSKEKCIRSLTFAEELLAH